MAVVIDSGPVTDRLGLSEVSRDRWFELMQVRRGFLAVHLPHDCRRLLEFVEDAEQMHGPLGFASVDDFIRRGLELDPQQVAWAIEGLRRMRPNDPIPYAKAQELGQKLIGIEGGKAGPGRGHKTADNISRFQHGTARAYILARLDRDGHSELAAKVRSDEMSAHAAALEVGYRTERTPLQKILKLLPKLNADERAEVQAKLQEMEKSS